MMQKQRDDMFSLYQMYPSDVEEIQEFVPGKRWELSKKSATELFEFNLDPIEDINKILCEDENEDFYIDENDSSEESNELFDCVIRKPEIKSNDDSFAPWKRDHGLEIDYRTVLQAPKLESAMKRDENDMPSFVSATKNNIQYNSRDLNNNENLHNNTSFIDKSTGSNHVRDWLAKSQFVKAYDASRSPPFVSNQNVNNNPEQFYMRRDSGCQHGVLNDHIMNEVEDFENSSVANVGQIIEVTKNGERKYFILSKTEINVNLYAELMKDCKTGPPLANTNVSPYVNSMETIKHPPLFQNLNGVHKTGPFFIPNRISTPLFPEIQKSFVRCIAPDKFASLNKMTPTHDLNANMKFAPTLFHQSSGNEKYTRNDSFDSVMVNSKQMPFNKKETSGVFDGRKSNMSSTSAMSLPSKMSRNRTMSTASSVASSFNKYCAFCKKNGETSTIYTSHNLHNGRRQVTCPVLFKHRCENCGATGHESHTLTYCPLINRSGKRPISTSVIVKSSMRKSNGQLRDANI